jgi:membrane protease YdiL (CAAX protease family)
MLSLFLVGSVAVAMSQRIQLFPRELPHWPGVAGGIAMYVAAIVVMRPLWRRTVLERARIVHLLVADTKEERAWWILVSLLAGIGEEITWRGVQTALLVPLVGSYWIAAALSGVSFALAHAMQGWRSMLGIFVFAIVFQLVVVASGSLYVAMAVHVAYDITAGLAYGRLARETGYVPDLGAQSSPG